MSRPLYALDNRLQQLVNATKFIKREDRMREASLMPHKWPAYRFLSPLDATRKFHKAYVAAYKDYVWRNIDRHQAENIKIGTKLNFHRANAHLTQVWKARQLADKLGMPYPEYLRFVFDFAARRTRDYAPQPNQLGPSARSREAWYAKLAEYWTPERYDTALARMNPTVQYLIDCDLGLPAQQQFRADLLDDLEQRDAATVGFIGRYVVSLRYLDADQCLDRRPAAVQNALEQLKHEPDKSSFPVHNFDTPQPMQFYQSCFGLPGINKDEVVCACCPCTGARF